jgi:hypothetical protein
MNNLELISVRGRVAIGIQSLLNAIECYDYYYEDWNYLIEQLSKYTITKQLDEWHEITAEYIPSTLNKMDTYIESEFDFLSENNFWELKENYKKSNDICLKIVDSIFEVGTINLYGSLVDNGKQSLDELVDIISLLGKNKIRTPNIEKYLIYSFAECDGWGIPFKFKKESGVPPQK